VVADGDEVDGDEVLGMPALMSDSFAERERVTTGATVETWTVST
jgi:hypothetical protein